MTLLKFVEVFTFVTKPKVPTDVERKIEFLQNKQSKQYETSRHSISNKINAIN